MAELIVLRLVHVVGGAFWVGTMIFNTVFLLPALRDSGPAAGPVMAGLQRRRMMGVLPVVAVLTLVTGARLLWLVSGGLEPSYFRDGTGQALALSGMLAVVAFLVGFFVSRPAVLRAGELSQRLQAESGGREGLLGEIQALRRRAAAAGMVVTTLLVLATAGMAVARYL